MGEGEEGIEGQEKQEMFPLHMMPSFVMIPYVWVEEMLKCDQVCLNVTKSAKEAVNIATGPSLVFLLSFGTTIFVAKRLPFLPRFSPLYLRTLKNTCFFFTCKPTKKR